jgi:hypothetical protein
MKAIYPILISLLVSQVSLAVECDPAFMRYFSPITKMTKAKSPWHSIDMTALRFSLSDRKNHVVYFQGFNRGELRDIGIGTVADCAQDPSVQISSEVPKEFFEGDAQAPFYGDSELERRLGLPLIAVILPFENIDPVMGNKVKIPLVLSNMMVHENFHGQQAAKSAYASFPAKFEPISLANNFPPPAPSLCDKKTGYGCRIPGSCISSPEWLKEVNLEMSDLQAVQDGWSKLSIARLKKIARKIVERRGTGTENKLTNQCWNSLREIERLEGTANYFAGALGRDAGIPDANETTLLKVAGPFRGTNRNMFVSGLEFFYVSGAILCRIMDRIDPSGNWQDRIQKGAPLDLTLSDLLARSP